MRATGEVGGRGRYQRVIRRARSLVMHGDFTRFAFDAAKQYSSVRMQQGRVLLDAEWNEQIDIEQFRARLALRDVIGCCGVPRDNAGFELGLTTTEGAPDITISAG